jgi:hypothetical protein
MNQLSTALRPSGFHARLGAVHARAHLLGRDVARLRAEHGQGTVEYVGLILLVSLLMVGMVAAMKNFQSDQGSAIADAIVSMMKSAISKISFR